MFYVRDWIERIFQIMFFRPQVDDMQRLRVEKMERQLANLTGLVQKALQVPSQPPAPAVAPRQEYQTYQARPPAQGKWHLRVATTATNVSPIFKIYSPFTVPFGQGLRLMNVC